MTTGQNELKSYVKHVPCDYRCRLDSKKGNSTQKQNKHLC